MRAAGALFLAFLRTALRNRQGLFWQFFFPIFLMVVFGLLGNLGQIRVRLVVTGPPSPARAAVARFFDRVPVFRVRTAGEASALGDVRRGEADAALRVPRDPGFPVQPLTLTLFYNSANYIAAQQTVAAVQASVAQLDLRLTGRAPVLRVASRALTGSRPATYLDFLVPGIMAMMAMQNSLFGLAVSLVRWKERGILRRFLVTPVRPALFLGAVVASQLLFNLASVVIVVGVAVVFLHVSLALPVLPLLVTLVLGIAAFLGLGFLVAGRVRTAEAAVPIANLISFPMMFLSGVWFPVSSLPPVLRTVVAGFPLTFLVDAVRGLTSGQISGFAPALGHDLLGLGAWLVASAAVSGWAWRWE